VDRDLLELRPLLPLGQRHRHLEDAVLEARLDRLGLDLEGERQAPEERAVLALPAVDVPFLDLALLLALAPQDQVALLGLLAGLAIGVGLGASLGLLYAPEKGRKTRREIIKRAERLGDSASDVLESAEDLIEVGRRKLAS
jgi:hypothetical protein